MKIQNNTGTLKFDNNGLRIENNSKSVCVEINPDASNIFQISKSPSKNGNYTDKVMYVDNNGNGYFNGEINAESGTIGGWDINTDSIYKNSAYYSSNDDTYQDGTTSLILSTNENKNYLEISSNYQEWFSYNTEKTSYEKKIQFTKSGEINITSYGNSPEGGTNIGNAIFSADGIYLHGISGAGLNSYEISLDSTGMNLGDGDTVFFSITSYGSVNCSDLTCNSINLIDAETVVINPNGNDYVYVPTIQDYSLLSAINGDWSAWNGWVRGVARQGDTEVVLLNEKRTGNIRLNLLYIKVNW